MCPIHWHSGIKKPATWLGRGLTGNTAIAQCTFAFKALLQLHSISMRGWLLLGQAMDIATSQ
jgi:hypothetical protein